MSVTKQELIVLPAVSIYVHNPCPLHLFGQILSIFAHKPVPVPFKAQTPVKQEESKLQELPIGDSADCLLHAMLESPTSPMNPSKQGPQVRGVFRQDWRFNEAQLLETVQSTLFIVPSAAFATAYTAEGS
mmetsp:Transcript_29629/g.40714  ORF Transcript_29629/g.40714 Transcript_29629/m.40714 type:complete len:130 (+) Transcript_29629:148-537(+)